MEYNPVRLATPEEVEFFSSKRGSDLSSLCKTFQEGVVTPNHMQAIREIAADISNLSDQVVGWYDTEWLREEGGLLTPDSNMTFESINMTANPYSKNGRRLFNLFKTMASVDGLVMLSRPLPISWGLEHIEERYKKRSPEDFDYASDFFQKVLGLSISMCRIIEQTTDWEYETRVPFILPAKRGVYLGWAERGRGGKNDSGNRIAFIAAKNYDALGMREYDWFPEVRLLINTYYGPDEMKPAHKQLRYLLIKLMEGQLGNSFFHELSSYSFVKNDIRFDIPEVTDAYENVFLKVADIMESPLWKKNVTLPQRVIKQSQFSP